MVQSNANLKPATFLLDVTKIIEEQHLIDINNILNTGDVPTLYELQDNDVQNKLAQWDCQDNGIDQTPLNLFDEFVCVDDEVGGFCREDRVLVFVVDFDVDLALDLVLVDDFDPLLDSIRLFRHI